MNIEELRNYCMTKKGVTEEFPFDKNILVFKVMGKMFALTSLALWEAESPSVNLKCDPEKAIELRNKYESVIAGYHMNKKHWNTVAINCNDVPDNLVNKLINHSYDLVVKGLTKKKQQELKML